MPLRAFSVFVASGFSRSGRRYWSLNALTGIQCIRRGKMFTIQVLCTLAGLNALTGIQCIRRRHSLPGRRLPSVLMPLRAFSVFVGSSFSSPCPHRRCLNALTGIQCIRSFNTTWVLAKAFKSLNALTGIQCIRRQGRVQAHRTIDGRS